MTARLIPMSQATMYRYDLAISAVPYDAILVDELSARIAPRLGAGSFWPGSAPAPIDAEPVASPSPFGDDVSRVTLVLHQRLWQHESTTQDNAAEIVQRLRTRPDSVRVVCLDAHPLPQWLASAPRCSLADVGLEGVADFVLDAIVACDGLLRKPVAIEVPPAPTHSPDGRPVSAPPPFLAQPRALSSLRRELDALAEALAPPAKRPAPEPAERKTELHALPNRLILQMGAVALSFSWVSGGLGTVGDGRLMVIEWEGAVASRGGAGALSAATAVRESVYRVEASDREGWRWRADGPNGRAHSTANLAAEWLANALITAA